MLQCDFFAKKQQTNKNITALNYINCTSCLNMHSLGHIGPLRDRRT